MEVRYPEGLFFTGGSIFLLIFYAVGIEYNFCHRLGLRVLSLCGEYILAYSLCHLYTKTVVDYNITFVIFIRKPSWLYIFQYINTYPKSYPTSFQIILIIILSIWNWVEYRHGAPVCARTVEYRHGTPVCAWTVKCHHTRTTLPPTVNVQVPCAANWEAASILPSKLVYHV